MTGFEFDQASQAVAAVEQLIKRYGLSYVDSRAVLLFDIVNFSLYTPFEQASQLNSLSYSLNSAHARMLEQDVDALALRLGQAGVEFSHSHPTRRLGLCR